jgi:hypothetical protein
LEKKASEAYESHTFKFTKSAVKRRIDLGLLPIRRTDSSGYTRMVASGDYEVAETTNTHWWVRKSTIR